MSFSTLYQTIILSFQLRAKGCGYVSYNWEIGILSLDYTYFYHLPCTCASLLINRLKPLPRPSRDYAPEGPYTDGIATHLTHYWFIWFLDLR